jgi:aldehyde:ferredoxin oxidoreductase
MPNAYMGKILKVDLTTGTIETEAIPDRVYEEVLAGAGLAARLLYDRIPAGADALGPDNILAFCAGLLTGTGAQFSGRWILAGKSPLTGGWGEANCGGHLSPAIKRCGVDGIFFSGISPKPVYLKVVGDQATLVDAAHLWGQDTVEAEEALKAEVGQKSTQIAVIGPAGEKLSLIAGVSTDGGRLAARSGLGAVMGSKRLKGIVLAGKQKISVAVPERMKSLTQTFMAWFKRGMGVQALLSKGIANRLGTILRVSPLQMAYTGDLIKLSFSKYGTITTNVLSSESGDSPCKNWGGAGSRDYPVGSHASKINPANITARESKKYHCFSCPLGCGGIVSWPEGKSPIKEMHKPEYETCCAFGTLILNNDLEAIFHLNDKLNRAGMDTIGAGGTAAFAIECCERGLLKPEDVDGLDLRWGNIDAVSKLIDKMIAREGCGVLFADGSKVAAKKIGKGAGEYAIHAGGQELPMHDTRFDPGFAVAYSCEPTPGRHTNYSYQWLEVYALNRLFPGLPSMKAFYSTKERYNFTPEKNALLVAASKFLQTANGCGLCQFGLQMGGNLPVPDYINAATGWNHQPVYYLEVGARIQALRQAFNVKHGIRTLVDFKLPSRVLGSPPLAAGPLKGVALDDKKLRGDFLRGMGWSPETAVPERATLVNLGLAGVANDLHGEAR